MGFKEFIKDKAVIVSLSLVLSLIVYMFVYPSYFMKTDPSRWYVAPKALPPSTQYPFGTTLTGQNLADVVPVALRNSITIGIVAAGLSILIALALAFSVVFLSRSAPVLSVLIDVMCTIPPLPLLITIIFAWREYITIPMIGLILAVFGWAWPSRALSGILMSLKERTFIYTSRLCGLPTYIMLLKDLLPYIIRYVLVNFINLTLWGIGMETTVAMFGALKMEVPTIGTTIYWALNFQAFFMGIWWWYLIPTAFLILFIVPLYIIGIKIDEHLISV